MIHWKKNDFLKFVSMCRYCQNAYFHKSKQVILNMTILCNEKMGIFPYPRGLFLLPFTSGCEPLSNTFFVSFWVCSSPYGIFSNNQTFYTLRVGSHQWFLFKTPVNADEIHEHQEEERSLKCKEPAPQSPDVGWQLQHLNVSSVLVQ